MTDRRAPVQGHWTIGSKDRRKPGTIAWWEHVEAWTEYASRYGRSQSAERIAERSGFGYDELIMFLGHEPTTWEPLK